MVCRICGNKLSNPHVRFCNECFKHVTKSDCKYIAEKHWNYWLLNKDKDINIDNGEYLKINNNYYLKEFCKHANLRHEQSIELIDEFAKLATSSYKNINRDLARVIINVCLLIQKYDQ